MKFFSTLLIIIWTSATVWAQDSTHKLQVKLSKMAAQCQGHQEKIEAEEKKLQNLEEERFKKTEALKKSQRQIDKYIAILQKLKAAQSTAIFNPKMSPQKLVQSLMVLNRFLSNMSSTAKYLQSEVKHMAKLEQDIVKNKETLLKQLKDYDDQYQKIQAALKKRKAAIQQEVKRRASIEKRVNRLASQSMSLHDLVRKLEREEKQAPKKTRQGKQALKVKPMDNHGKYKSKPVPGPLVSRFGQPHKKMDSEGSGIVYRNRQRSHVSSPVYGQVVYAGDFRGYKQILILAHDKEYHTLLTGLENVDVSVGQTVLPGEPVGVMGSDSPEYLYLELRKNGRPINPEGWLCK